MSQYQSAYRIQHLRSSRLKSLAATSAVAGLLIAGSAGIAAAAISSSALPVAAVATGTSPQNCPDGYVIGTGLCLVKNT
jgi:hypothetical protein